MLEILNVNTKSLQKEFVEFQYKLYEDCPQFVPPFRSDIFMMMNKEKHPFYDHSDSDHFIAKRDGKVVGKIAALENKPFNEFHHVKDAQFYLFDCIDDQEVANALFDKVTEWARGRGLTHIVGPKGYGPLDGYGIQVEGFEHRQMMNMMNYNYPYYQQLAENYGFVKEVDFVSSYLEPQNYELPEKIKKAVEIVKKRGRLRVMNFRNKKHVIEWKYKIKDAYNRAFVHNWEYYPLSDRELDYAVDNAIQVVVPSLLNIILNEDDDIVGFVLPFPDVSAAMQKNKGRLGPVGIIRLLRELKTTQWLDFNGIGILPEYQGMGGNALLMDALLKAAQADKRFIHSELTQVAETAIQMRKDLDNLGVRYYKNHRVYGKNID
ncbi:MAG: GNAT family N-acetyltransferase [Anaerolineaceae bacterium]|nr:GNAT family N-acetyltransferase [Anaerolineaceae bacterium]MDD4041997.1 GNAT family N-acetyltransferase [Anaerolineaceae bacterium]MDD4578360.1 GNAT family N-acetyltransferase [Anaerolineaceae bacterium]